MIQDIQPKQYHNEYTPRPIREDDVVFVFRGREVLLREEPGNLVFPRGGETKEKDLQYLFSIDDRAFYLGREPVGGFDFQPMRLLRKCTPQDFCFAGMTAWHLYNWYEGHKFCGKCGKPLRHHNTLRALECGCGNLVFPVIAPAVIVAVTNGDKLLVSRYAGREFKGLALIAGFCEIGERAEDTVRREVLEEAGLRVKNIRYFNSQPWGYASNLLLGFVCDLDGSDEIHFDEEELQSAFWISRAELEPVKENLLSLTGTMMETFRQGKL
jgi:NAD+ diphosphatase